MQEMTGILNRPANCAATFGGRDPKATAMAATSLTYINPTTGANVPRFKTTTVDPNIRYGTSLMKFTRFSLSDAHPDVDVDTDNSTHLIVSIDLGERFKPRYIQKRIKVFVETNGAGMITACNSSIPVNANSDIYQQMCEDSLQGTFDTGTNICTLPTPAPTPTPGVQNPEDVFQAVCETMLGGVYNGGTQNCDISAIITAAAGGASEEDVCNVMDGYTWDSGTSACLLDMASARTGTGSRIHPSWVNSTQKETYAWHGWASFGGDLGAGVGMQVCGGTYTNNNSTYNLTTKPYSRKVKVMASFTYQTDSGGSDTINANLANNVGTQLDYKRSYVNGGWQPRDIILIGIDTVPANAVRTYSLTMSNITGGCGRMGRFTQWVIQEL